MGKKAIKAIGNIAMNLPNTKGILENLLSFLQLQIDYISNMTFVVLKDLLRKFPGNFSQVINVVEQLLWHHLVLHYSITIVYWANHLFFWTGLALNLTEAAIDRQIERIVKQFGDGLGGNSQGEGAELSRTLSWVPASRVKEESRILTADDFGISETPTLGDEDEKARVLAEVDALIGKWPGPALHAH